jgi:ligand-binding SRPBCC domain-containing protein
MVRLSVDTLIKAPINLCFDLARDMNAHAETMAKSGERIVSAPPSGVLEMGDEVTFEASHFGIRQRLTGKIVQFERPSLFTDQMLKGAFKSLRHEHHFRIEGESTRMTDIVVLEAPLGPLGLIAERLFLRGYMQKLLAERGDALRRMAEASASKDDQASAAL